MPEITILVDNTVATPRPRGLRGEWGFAAAVDGVLFDTGQGDAVAHNAALLGREAFDTVVVSHGHWDHTGGLQAVLDPDDPPTVYAHPAVWRDRYRTDGDDRTAIGIPHDRATVERGAEVVEHRDPVEVAPGVTALGEIPRPHEATTVGEFERDGTVVADPVPDDQALAVRTAAGVALVLGCCHAGLRNTVEYAERVTGEPVRYVVGGTHLVALDGAAVRELADWLAGRLDLFAGVHCTGSEAQSIFAERLPDAFHAAGVGSTFELPPRTK